MRTDDAFAFNITWFSCANCYVSTVELLLVWTKAHSDFAVKGSDRLCKSEKCWIAAACGCRLANKRVESEWRHSRDVWKTSRVGLQRWHTQTPLTQTPSGSSLFPAQRSQEVGRSSAFAWEEEGTLFSDVIHTWANRNNLKSYFLPFSRSHSPSPKPQKNRSVKKMYSD